MGPRDETHRSDLVANYFAHGAISPAPFSNTGSSKAKYSDVYKLCLQEEDKVLTVPAGNVLRDEDMCSEFPLWLVENTHLLPASRPGRVGVPTAMLPLPCTTHITTPEPSAPGNAKPFSSCLGSAPHGNIIFFL